MAEYAITYAVAVMFLFFATSALLPAVSGRASSLAGVANDADTFTGQAYQAVVWSFAFLLMLPSWRIIFRVCLRVQALLALSLLAPVSALWSQNPSLSLRRGVFLVLGTLFAVYLVGRFSTKDLAQMVVIAGLGAAALSLLVVVFIPSVGLDGPNGGVWQGIFHSKNGCAQVMLFFLAPAVAFRFRTKVMAAARLALIPLAFLIIFMSNAKTAWILTPCYIAFIAVASWATRLRRKDALLVIIGGFAAVVLIASALPYTLPVILQALGKDAQLTGRLPLWASAMLSFAKRPLLGYGYQAFWTGMNGESLNVFMGTHFEIYQAQNGLLEIALELGLAGVVLVLFTLFHAVRDALVCFQHGQSEATIWYAGILVLSVAYNIDEAFLALAHSLPWLLYVVACAGLSMEARRVRSRRHLRAPAPRQANVRSLEGEAVAHLCRSVS